MRGRRVIDILMGTFAGQGWISKWQITGSNNHSYFQPLQNKWSGHSQQNSADNSPKQEWNEWNYQL